MLKKCVERFCELANKKVEPLYKVSSPCLDDEHFKQEELESVGELSEVCSQIVLKCLNLARVGRPDILWSVNKLARSVTKMNFFCASEVSHILLKVNLSFTSLKTTKAVIKMKTKGRSPTMRHVSRTHRVALDWLFDRINLESQNPNQICDTKNQLADILTKGSCSRNEWSHLLCLFKKMGFSMYSCNHFKSFLPLKLESAL